MPLKLFKVEPIKGRLVIKGRFSGYQIVLTFIQAGSYIKLLLAQLIGWPLITPLIVMVGICLKQVTEPNCPLKGCPNSWCYHLHNIIDFLKLESV